MEENHNQSDFQPLDSFEEEAQSPFSLGKLTIDFIISIYLSRKLCEEVDFLSKKGGIKYLEAGLRTNLAIGLSESEIERLERVNIFDSNESRQKTRFPSAHLCGRPCRTKS